MSFLSSLLGSSPPPPKKRVFISFDHDDRKQIDGLRLLNRTDAYEIEFYDESLQTAVDSENETYVRRVIRDKINRASVTVCLIGARTHLSKWVAWELEESDTKGNKIIAMALKGIERATLPALINTRVKAGTMTFHAWDYEVLSRLINNA